jgi:SAM-dependent methyltransferase
MYYLSLHESENFVEWSEQVIRGEADPQDFSIFLRPVMLPAFHFYCGVLLCKLGQLKRGLQCFVDGALYEADNMFSNAFIASFMERHDLDLLMPAVCFEDPRPYIHFTTTPELKLARKNFLKQCALSLPHFEKPLRFMDIGTGNGALAIELLHQLRRTKVIDGVEEILLIDASRGMLELAEKNVKDEFPNIKITTILGRIQDVIGNIEGHYDIALCSLSYHHMPMEHKQKYMLQLKDKFDHLLLFEINADNDLPDMDSPELLLSVYQSYGGMIDFIFAHDAPLEVAIDAVDSFLMTEQMSFLLQQRGERTDYHALRSQWVELFEEVLKPEFECLSNGTCFAEDFFELFNLHYGRK